MMLEEANINGALKVIRRLAEEGKIFILDDGGFEDTDAVLLLHPTTGVSEIAGKCRSSHNLDATFPG